MRRIILERIPLVPAAAGLTAGLAADRYLSFPVSFPILTFLVAVAAWLAAVRDSRRNVAIVFMFLAFAALGAIRHHLYVTPLHSNDIRNFVGSDPQLVRIRGLVISEPRDITRRDRPELRTIPPKSQVELLISVRQAEVQNKWLPVCGRVAVYAPGVPPATLPGDAIEIVGWLRNVVPPGNPGQQDRSAILRDQGVGAVLSVRHSAGTVKLRAACHSFMLERWLVAIRRWGREQVDAFIAPGQRTLARALLLGDQAVIDQKGWDRLQRTGVCHVLAISGQHLMMLALLASLLLRSLAVGCRTRGVLIAAIVFAYALITGGRPPAIRAALMIAAFCLAMLCHRRTSPFNALALAWVIIALLQPTAPFYAGTVLSFVAVGTLCWAASLYPSGIAQPPETTPAVLRLARGIGTAYLATLLVWIVLSPLVASRFHIVTVGGLLLGPPVLLLSSIALALGFATLVAALLLPVFAAVAGYLTSATLALCDRCVNVVHDWPGCYAYVPAIPAWWVAGFYAVALVAAAAIALRCRWQWSATAVLAWLAVGLATVPASRDHKGLRCTFLDVGHGACVVLETDDGRVLLYDAGAIAGPEVTRSRIAPYLWSRGIGRIDEVFLSHADLDHFNGLPDLLERFRIGRITVTPSFQNRRLRAVRRLLTAIEGRGIPMRIVAARDRLTAGKVGIRVLNPPPVGPKGVENARSLVLAVTYSNRTILLTGDLEQAGTQRLLNIEPLAVDVLMAPHHGSPSANTDALARWARPKLVISTQRRPQLGVTSPTPSRYARFGAKYLTTGEHGAVTVTIDNGQLWLETYRTRLHWRVE